MGHGDQGNKKRLRVLCYVNHFYGEHPTFVGKSTTEPRDLRRIAVERTLAALRGLDAEIDIKICGIEGHALVPLDITFNPADSTHLVYESLAHMAGKVADGYDYFLNIEDDIEMPPQTLANVVEFESSSLLNEVLHPLRIERRPEGPYLVDLAAMPGFTVQQRMWQGLRLSQAINPHCGLMLLSQKKFAYALQFLDLSAREVFLGGPMASAFAAIHRPFMLWRVFDEPTRHAVYHIDEWLALPPLAGGASPAFTERFTAIVLSWARVENLSAVVGSLRTIQEIDEILLWSNDRDRELEVPGVTVFKLPTNDRCVVWNALVKEARNENIWMQDDDVLIEPEQFRALLVRFREDEERIVGCRGRNLRR
jgi:hypothetical protein